MFIIILKLIGKKYKEFKANANMNNSEPIMFKLNNSEFLPVIDDFHKQKSKLKLGINKAMMSSKANLFLEDYAWLIFNKITIDNGFSYINAKKGDLEDEIEGYQDELGKL